jgi:predicted transcriptional regulator
MTGTQLRQLRRELHISQREVAQAIAKNQTYVCAAELDTIEDVRKAAEKYLLSIKKQREQETPKAA